MASATKDLIYVNKNMLDSLMDKLEAKEKAFRNLLDIDERMLSKLIKFSTPRYYRDEDYISKLLSAVVVFEVENPPLAANINQALETIESMTNLLVEYAKEKEAGYEKALKLMEVKI